MNWYAREQHDLVSTLRRAGPDAPTLCEGWRTRHLAAHLYLRLHRPWRMVAGILPGVEDADALTLRMGDEHLSGGAYEQLLDAFLAQPAWWNPMGRAGDGVHLLEYVVHHEDVRRANGPVPPRSLPAEQLSALWVQVVRPGPAPGWCWWCPLGPGRWCDGHGAASPSPATPWSLRCT